MAGPFKFEVQFNWQNQGFKEYYFTADADLATAQGRVSGLVKARAAVMPKDPTFYIWGVRVSDIANPSSTDFTRFSTTGTYTPPTAQQAASIWDAWLFIAHSPGGIRKVMEMRGIPTSLTGIVGNVPIPGDPWLSALNTFRGYLKAHTFGILHAVVPPRNQQPNIVKMAPAASVDPQPTGSIVVTTDANHGIPVNSQATVVFRTVRCTPKVAPRHVGVYVTATSFYLKNTDVGTLEYQGGGRMFVPVLQVALSDSRDDIRSSIRKPGKAHGAMVGRKLKRV